MVRYFFFIPFAATFLPHAALAQSTLCPLSLSTKGTSIEQPAGWQSYAPPPVILEKDGTSYHLYSINFVEDDDIDFLPPSKTGNTKDSVSYHWQFNKKSDYEIDCIYDGTSTHLTQKLTPGLKSCEAIYKKGKDGKLSFSTAQCN
ncbi:MAG TPA: STY0301 family protein [Rickettsiales bacterium]|nr:STY0301 family protein [Rickettsiales bacterium]